MNDKILIVKGLGGLGNRIRTTAAAVEYAKRTDRKIYIDWSEGLFGKEGRNVFSNYFQLTNVDIVFDLSSVQIESFYPSVYKYLDIKKDLYQYFQRDQVDNRYLRKGLQYFFRAINTIGGKNKLFQQIEFSTSQKYQSFVLKPEFQKQYSTEGRFSYGGHLKERIEADAVLYCDTVPFYDASIMRECISLKPWIREKVNEFVQNNRLKEDAVGVHVRALDKKMFGDNEKFIIKLRHFIKQNNIKRILLCTDNLSIEERFIKEFGEMVIVQQKHMPDVSEKKKDAFLQVYAKISNDEELKSAMTEEAIIDMFALAETKYLFFHFGSTFSEISAVYHNNKETCRNWTTL